MGYSPERINPGDKVHTVRDIIKVVSGSDKEALDEIAGILETGLGSTVHENAGKIYELRENEKILGIFVQLAKLKALRLTRKLGDSSLRGVANLYREVHNPVISLLSWTRAKLTFVRKKIG